MCEEGDPTRPILALALAVFLLVVGVSESASDSREIDQASEILAKIEQLITEGDLVE